MTNSWSITGQTHENWRQFDKFTPCDVSLLLLSSICLWNLIINMSVKSNNQVKYLGLIFDSNLNWKPYLHELSKKVSRGIGVLSKIRYYVNRNILHQLYYSIIYPFLTYGLWIWGNTYSTTLKSLITLQKRAIRTISFSKPDEHSEPLFKELEILKLTDLVTLHNALLMYHY